MEPIHREDGCMLPPFVEKYLGERAAGPKAFVLAWIWWVRKYAGVNNFNVLLNARIS